MILKRNKLLIHITWMKFKCIMLHERSPTRKAMREEFHLYDILEQAKLQEQKTGQWLPEAGARGQPSRRARRNARGGEMELVSVLVLAGVTQLHESDETQSWILKRVNICKLYLDLKKTIKNVNSQHCSGLSLQTGRRRCHGAPEGQARAPGAGTGPGTREHRAFIREAPSVSTYIYLFYRAYVQGFICG